MAVRRIDVSMPLYEGMPGFPGDPPLALRPVHRIDRGDAYNLSRIELGTHAGTHVDPPVHFVAGANPIDRVDLDILNGPCRVVAVPGSCSVVSAAEAEAVPPGTARVLFRTSNSERWATRLEFFEDYVGLDLAAAEVLVRRGVRLVGIDSLSVERDPTGRFPVHHTLLGHGVLILEGLLLAHTPPGEYDLACLPLRIRAGDGGPARVTLSGR